MDLTVISSPLPAARKLDVVSVEEVKLQARIAHDEEDELIASYVVAAYDHLSGPHGWLNGYVLLREQFELYVAGPYREAEFELPLRPVDLAEPISFASWDGTAYVDVDPALYGPMIRHDTVSLARTSYTPWPYFGLPYARAYRLRFWAGHASAATIPEPIKLSIKMLAATWFANRETLSAEGRSAGQDLPYGLKALCGRYRMALDHS